MITSLSQLDLNKKYSYAEYLTWQFQEHLELIRGRIFRMTPAPTRRHQKASFKLSLQIGNYLNNRSCEVYTAPFDVRFPKEGGDDNTYTVVQPDICVICDKSKLDDRGCVGAPDFIIEILSPTTGAKDATIKFDLYEEQGVREYWMVYPGEHLLDVFLLDDKGKYQFVKKYTQDDKVKVNVFEDLYVDMSEVFKD
ncbi:Uma2 family endonuclease [Plebeiibacterium marinum]|uniref:Uma2 family endonuclease n=1 Tax=Plebeiibacterium marinum TaxID=2992111 RepID=A0AAE3SKE2_9BACT|nr:Uma2 family endonuclease [Plebeiobacterium marinum]MCW3805405.1 Uma2 family endonuclease [Plebeiobacterium marinum]